MFTWISSIMPIAVAAVRWVERLLGAGKGEDKLAAVLELLKAALPQVAETPEQQTELQAGLAQIVNGIVKVLNATGTFTHSQ